MAAVSGAVEGWRSVFLGPDLPAHEIAAAALRQEAEAVALSVVDPRMAPAIPAEVMDLRRRLPPDVHLLVGGAMAKANRGALEMDGVEVLETLEDLRDTLRRMTVKG
jgi:methylmalonyl-CoA mutase cobalamin-binding subunit